VIRYRHDPDRPDQPTIEATPRDLDAYRPLLRAYIARRFAMLGFDGIEDVVQDALIVGTPMITGGWLRGTWRTKPEEHVKAWLLDAAWRCAMNARRSRGRHRHDHVGIDEAHEIEHRRQALDEHVDSRLVLGRIFAERHVRATYALLAYDRGVSVYDLAAQLGVDVRTLFRMIGAARRRLTVVHRRPKKKQRNR